MAIVWGPYQNHMRIGVNITQTPSSVTSSTTSVRLDFSVWVQMDSSSSQYINNATMQFSGTWGDGSKVFAINLGPGQSARVHTTSGTYATTSSSQALAFGVSVSHYHGLTGYPARGWTIPARPAAPPPVPSAPSSLQVSRSSDTRHVVSWTRNSTYTSVEVQRRENDGSWKKVGQPTSNPSSWTDTTTKANRKYQYRVRGINAGGTSSFSSSSGVIYTTPAAPGSVSATRLGSGIRVSVGSIPAYATHFDIQDDGSTVVSALAGGSLPWTHAAPSPSVPHRYRVRARVSSGGSGSTTLYSDWSTYSATVQLTAPPAAPAMLAPNGQSRLYDVIPLSWRHTPVDSSEQTQYQVRARTIGGAWTEGTPVSTDVEADPFLPWVYTIDEPAIIEWEVRTKGAHPDWSPWSATATIDAIDAPQVTITSPDVTVDRPDITVEWEWFQAQDRPQSAWELTLTDTDDTVLETRSGFGATALVALTSRLEDAADYTVTVRAATGETWSEPSALSVHVAFVPPPAPELSAEWDDTAGAMQVSVGHVEDPELPAAVAVDVLRSLDEGQTWETVIAGSDPDLILPDWEALSSGGTMYRAIAYTAIGASAITDITAFADSPAMWLSGGDEYEITARLPYDPAVKVTAGRERSVQRYEGRSLGVAYAGAHITRTVDASGTLLQHDEENASIARMEDVAIALAPIHLYRDPDGRRIYGALSNVSLPRESAGSEGAVWGFAFQLEETDH